jgi:hypothetical protein
MISGLNLDHSRSSANRAFLSLSGEDSPFSRRVSPNRPIAARARNPGMSANAVRHQWLPRDCEPTIGHRHRVQESCAIVHQDGAQIRPSMEYAREHGMKSGNAIREMATFQKGSPQQRPKRSRSKPLRPALDSVPQLSVFGSCLRLNSRSD